MEEEVAREDENAESAAAAAPVARGSSRFEQVPVDTLVHILEFVTIDCRVYVAACNKSLRRLLFAQATLWEDLELGGHAHLTDTMLATLLRNVNAKQVTKYLLLPDCPLIGGMGLEPLRYSRILETVCLEKCPLHSEATALQILRTMIPYKLTEVYLPHGDEDDDENDGGNNVLDSSIYSKSARLFLSDLRTAKIHQAIEKEIRCDACQELVAQASQQLVPGHIGVPSTRCNDCYRHFCRKPSCPMHVPLCQVCGYVSCIECEFVETCHSCSHSYCNSCVYMGSCNYCGTVVCDACDEGFKCDLCGTSKDVCLSCRPAHNADEENGFHCNECSTEFCGKCRTMEECFDCARDLCSGCLRRCSECNGELQQFCAECFERHHSEHDNAAASGKSLGDEE